MSARITGFITTRPKIWLYAGVALLALVAALACEPAPIPAPATVTPNPAPAQATPDSAPAPATPASTPGPVSFADPPGDCWGGVLSADPVHCHALEEIQRDDLIEVEGMYEGGGALFVYFLLASDVTTYGQLHQALKKKAVDFAAKNPNKGNYELATFRPPCDQEASEEVFRACVIDFTFDQESMIIPWASAYGIIHLRPGGGGSAQSGGRLGVVEPSVARAAAIG